MLYQHQPSLSSNFWPVRNYTDKIFCLVTNFTAKSIGKSQTKILCFTEDILITKTVGHTRHANLK